MLEIVVKNAASVHVELVGSGGADAKHVQKKIGPRTDLAVRSSRLVRPDRDQDRYYQMKDRTTVRSFSVLSGSWIDPYRS